VRTRLVPTFLSAIVTAVALAATTAGASPTAEEAFLKKVEKIAGERQTVDPESYEQALKESKAICVCLEALDQVTNRTGAVVFIRGVGQSFVNCLVPRFDADGALDLALTTTCPGDWAPVTK
jgi:hypothetical protein